MMMVVIVVVDLLDNCQRFGENRSVADMDLDVMASSTYSSRELWAPNIKKAGPR